MSDSIDATALGRQTIDATGSPTETAILVSGDAIARYTVLGQLGAGGMGVVYAAYDPELDRKLAIKLLRVTGRADGDGVARARLVREAQAMAQLDHPNVVTVYEVGDHRGDVYIAMEFVEGVTFGAWVKATARTWAEILSVLDQAARGLSAAHAAGLVHRDFKPDNVMVGSDGRVRVMDFGLVRSTESADGATASSTTAGNGVDALDIDPTAAERPSQQDTVAATPESSTRRESEELESEELAATRAGAVDRTGSSSADLTVAGSMLGTPAYMAPEQFRHAPTDARTDQFSYCVTLWEALYGERPFTGTTMLSLMLAVTEGKRRPVPRRTQVPSWLRRACDRGLATDPSQRFDSIQQLLDAIEAGRRGVRTRWVLAGVGAIVAIAAASYAANEWDQRRRIDACAAEADAIARVWNPEAEASLRAALSAVDPVLADEALTRARPWFTRYAESWRTARTRACMRAEVERSWDADTNARARWCLDERLLQLEATLEVFAHASDPSDRELLTRLVPAAAGLESVDPCLREGTLAVQGAPPSASEAAALDPVRHQLADIDGLIAAARYDEAIREGRRALAAAESSSWSPIRVGAALRLGHALDESGAYEEAEAVLEDAYFDAATQGLPEQAFGAAIELVTVVGYRRRRTSEGLRWGRLAELAESQSGASSLRTARRLHSLAIVHKLAGELEPAVADYEAALERRRAVLGDTHTDVAETLHSLGNVLQDLARYDQARVRYDEALAIRTELLGPEHPDVAQTLVGLANLTTLEGDDEQALAIHERALALFEAALGPEHPHVALAHGNLAGVLLDLGRIDEALDHAELSASIYAGKFGDLHPSSANAFNLLGAIHYSRGEFDAAFEFYTRAAAGLEATYGHSHREVANVLHNLGLVDQQRGEIELARSHMQEALTIREARLGREHPEVADSLTDLAILEATNDRGVEALAAFERALAIRRVALALDHPDLWIAVTNLVAMYEMTNDVERIRALYLETIAEWSASLGESDLALGRPLNTLASFELAQGRPLDALGPAERAVKIRQAEGATPLQRAYSEYLLAQILGAAERDPDRAEELARRALAAYREVGDRAETVAEIEVWLAAQGP